MSDKQIIVTVSGVDKVGIVAGVTTELARFEVNIEDIKQTLMQGHFVMFLLGNIEKSLMQGHFVMFLLGNIEKSKFSFAEIKEGLTKLGEKMGMEIWVQRKEIFDSMHNIA